MGFPTEFFPVLFAIPRMAGYLAHWRESLDDSDTKIMRPQQVLYIYNCVAFTKILYIFWVQFLNFYLLLLFLFEDATGQMYDHI